MKFLPFAVLASVLLLLIQIGCGDDDDDSGGGGESVCEQFCEIIAACPAVAEALGITSMDQCLEYCNGVDNETGNCVINATSCDEVAACFKTTDDDDDDSSDDDDDDTEPDCTNNHPPVISVPTFHHIKDYSSLSPMYMPAVLYIGVDDIGFTSRFDDADCNMEGGKVHVKTDDEPWVELESSIPASQTCGYKYTGAIKLYWRNPVGYGDHQIYMYYTDACEAESHRVTFDFTVVDPPEGEGQELINNGSFEEGYSGWESHSLLGYSRIYIMSDDQAFYHPTDGEWVALMGGYMNGHDILQQTVEFPETVDLIQLEVQVHGQTSDFDGEGGDFLDIYLAGAGSKEKTLLKRISDFDCFDYYGLVRALLEGEEAQAFSNQEALLVFEYFSDSDDRSTYFHIDEVSLKTWSQDNRAKKKQGKEKSPEGLIIYDLEQSPFFAHDSIYPVMPRSSKAEDCDENEPPVLWLHEIQLEDKPITPPLQGYPGELISTVFHWEDPECDIYGGGWYAASQIPYYFWMTVLNQFYDIDDYGCGTDTEPHIIFRTDLLSNYLIQMSYFQAMTDACGAFSEPVFHSFHMLLPSEEDEREDAILNGGFEMGATGWADGPPPYITFLDNPDEARVGDGCVKITGDRPGILLDQASEIPSQHTMVTLAFWLKMKTTDPEGTQTDTLSVRFAGAADPLATFDNSMAGELGTNWHYFYYEVSERIGTAFTLEFMGDFEGDQNTSFYLDEISIRSD